MRAKKINEENYFERSGNVSDQMGIGMGPIKYIPKFEKILDTFGIDYTPDDPPEEMNRLDRGWIINDPNPIIDELSIYCVPKDNLDSGRAGWYVYGRGTKAKSGPDKNPWRIVRELLHAKYVSIDDEISAMEDSLVEMKKIKSQLNNLNNYISDES